MLGAPVYFASGRFTQSLYSGSGFRRAMEAFKGVLMGILNRTSEPQITRRTME
jgi:hypothetical protein